MLSFAAAMESRYIMRALSLPSRDELLKTWAAMVPADESAGK